MDVLKVVSVRLLGCFVINFHLTFLLAGGVRMFQTAWVRGYWMPLTFGVVSAPKLGLVTNFGGSRSCDTCLSHH